MGFAAGFGAVAGAALRSRAEDRADEEYQYRKGERAREDAFNTAAGLRLANVGQDVTTDYTMPAGARGNLDEGGAFQPVKSRYTAEQAYEDIGREGGRLGVSPVKIAKTQATGLQLQNAQRENRYAKSEEGFFNFMQNNAHLPDEEFYKNGAAFATKHVPDGKSFGVTFDENEGWRGVVTNPDGTSSVVPIKSRDGFARTLQRYTSPKMMQEANKADLQERELGVKERGAATMEGYRRDQAEHMRRQDDILSKWRNDQAGLLRDKNDKSSYARMPEADRIYLQSLEGRKKNFETLLAKPDLDPTQIPQMQRGYRQVLGDEYGMLKKHKLIPEGVTLSRYRGLPDPMKMVLDAVNAARSPQELQQSMAQFKMLYEDDPDAADAFNAAEDMSRRKFGNQVQPQNQRAQVQVSPFFSAPSRPAPGAGLGAYGIQSVAAEGPEIEPAVGGLGAAFSAPMRPTSADPRKYGLGR